MNLSSITGFILAVGVLWEGVIGPSKNRAIFLDSHAIILVVGGTLAAALIGFPVRRVLDLAKLFVFGVLLKRHADNPRIAIDIIKAAPTAQNSSPFLKMCYASHPFLKEGFALIAEGVLGEKELIEVLNKRSQYFKKSYLADAKMLNALAKFPPAFGLLGASTGMITMMTGLGAGGADTIGPAMAIALVATFWGIAVANLLLLPLADYASRIANDDASTRQMIVEGLTMLRQKCDQIAIAERMNSFLPPDRRITYKAETTPVRERSGSRAA